MEPYDPLADSAPTPVTVAALDVDGVRAVTVGTALWSVAFLALLPFYGFLGDSGRLWWLWTCAAGASMGLFGIEYCRRRRDRTDPVPSASPPTPQGGRRRA